MTDVNILTLFGLDISELERHERTGDGFVRFAIRLSYGAEMISSCLLLVELEIDEQEESDII